MGSSGGSDHLRRLGLPWRRTGVRAAVLAVSVSLVALAGLDSAPSNVAAKLPPWPSNVFTVGTLGGTAAPPGQGFTAIQPAVDAAEAYARGRTSTSGVVPATYVLVAPGDYKTIALDTPPAGAPPQGSSSTSPTCGWSG